MNNKDNVTKNRQYSGRYLSSDRRKTRKRRARQRGIIIMSAIVLILLILVIVLIGAILFFGYLFVSVGTVGFNEIIIFFFYGLEENTYMFIKNRSDNTEKVTQADLDGRKSCFYMEMKDEERDSL